MSRLVVLFILPLISITSAQARTLTCQANFLTGGHLLYATPMMKEQGHIDQHSVLYETLRADCSEGYVIDLEGYGPGLAIAAGEAFVVSCPFVDNFRGTYVGPKVRAAGIFGIDLGAFVGPGVCFIMGGEAIAIGAGASISIMRIMHHTDREEVHPAPSAPVQEDEIPEEAKFLRQDSAPIKEQGHYDERQIKNPI